MSANVQNILIVDKIKSIRRAIALYLELRGYRTLEAEHGREAMEMMDRHDVGLILVDLMISGMDTATLAERIKTTKIGVIFMSSYLPDPESGFGSENDTFPVLVKPFAGEELLGEIEKRMPAALPVCS
ncbi:MAG TPA: response regulator [bacterium]|nr:response regulator [bacterium]HPQ65384.1 response regulator [bacterium]